MAAGNSPEKQELIDAWRYETSWPARLELTERLLREKIWPSRKMEAYEKDTGLYPDIEDYDFLPKLLRKKQFDDLRQSSLKEGLMARVRKERARAGQPPLAEGAAPTPAEVSKYLEGQVAEKCRATEDFELSSTQNFASRFLNPRTPYRGALFYHGVGVGKTCAAVTVCENFLEMYPGREVFIVAPAVIQAGFRRTIFSTEKEDLILGSGGKPNHHRGCTGDLYLNLTDTLTSPNRSLIENRVTKLINKRYKFFGYTAFANYIEDLVETTDKIEDPELRESKIAELLHTEFQNRLLVVDEAHNLRDNPLEGGAEDSADDASVDIRSEAAAGKKLTPFLRKVLRYSEGLTLLLMTATPMYNSYTEIVFLLNLLLMNDKFPELRIDDIFDRDTETFRPGGKKILGSIVGTYMSFMRGEDPLSFPVRLYPEAADRLSEDEYPNYSPLGVDIEEEPDSNSEGGDEEEEDENNASAAEGGDSITKAEVVALPLVPCYFSEETELEYKKYSNEVARGGGGLNITNLNDLVQAGNWIFPGTGSVQERMGQKGFDAVFEKEYRGTSAVYQCIAEEGTSWLEEEAVNAYSAKCAVLLKRLRNGQGVSFVYSRFVAAGALAIAMCMEVNGYTLYGRDYGFLSKVKKSPRGRQCALCPEREVGHAAADGHSFAPAKFILLTGSEELSGDNRKSIDAARNRKNLDGRDIKVILGSQIAGEGLDLRFIREVFVFDSWFHLNKLEQIVGRGVRKCSHADLPREKQNCTVSFLVNTYAIQEEDNEGEIPSTIETVDTYSYRVALRKAKVMGKVTRVLKQYAMDCTLNYDAIVNELPDTYPKIEMIDSQGVQREEVDITDKPFTAQCDWLGTCTYECKYTPGRKFKKQPAGSLRTYGTPPLVGPDGKAIVEVDTTSLDEFSSRYLMRQFKTSIERQFELEAGEKGGFVSVKDFLGGIPGVPQPLLRSFLSDMIAQKEYRMTLGGTPGKILLQNEYLVFQPDFLESKDIPIALRVSEMPIPRDSYGFFKPEEVEVEETDLIIDSNEYDSEELWTAASAFCLDIQEGAVDHLDEDLLHQVSLLPISKGVMKAQKEKLEMILWLYESVKESDEQREALAKAVRDFFWDEFITSGTKKALFKKEAKVLEGGLATGTAKDAVMTIPGFGTYLRVPRNQRTLEEIKAFAARPVEKKKPKAGTDNAFDLLDFLVVGADGKAKDVGVAQREKVKQETGTGADPILRKPIDTTTTGFEYGFLQYSPKFNSFVFKKSKVPKVGAKVARGAQCVNNSSIRYEIDLLEELGETIQKWSARAGDAYTLGLLPEEFGPRRVTNSVRICTLINLVLRYMDHVRVDGKRWFYRPLEAVVHKHPLV